MTNLEQYQDLVMTDFRQESSKMLAITLFGLQGTTYVYQGEEIAMTNAYFTSIDQYDDAESKGAYYDMISKGLMKKKHY